jgi:hypothetical protein
MTPQFVVNPNFSSGGFQASGYCTYPTGESSCLGSNVPAEHYGCSRGCIVLLAINSLYSVIYTQNYAPQARDAGRFPVPLFVQKLWFCTCIAMKKRERERGNVIVSNDFALSHFRIFMLF